MPGAHVELELAGAAADTRIPALRPHPQGCPACHDDHASRYALRQAELPPG
jgi:hypothetical protein